MEQKSRTDSKADTKAKKSQAFEHGAPDLLDVPPPPTQKPRARTPVPTDPSARKNPAYQPLPHYTQATSLTDRSSDLRTCKESKEY